MDEQIEQLIAEYNEAERQQTERLRTLFYILKARKGNRFIKFTGGDLLNNCWDMPEERLDAVYYLNKYNRGIDEVGTGQE